LKFKILYIAAFLFLLSCDRSIPTISNDNPFDTENELTGGDPFEINVMNYSDYIAVTWAYEYENPIPEGFNLYRVDNQNGNPILRYSGNSTSFEDDSVQWDSTYTYYVTVVVDGVESTPPDFSELPPVMRRIYVGLDAESSDFTSIQTALDVLKDSDVVYVKDGTYVENINFGGKAIAIRSINGPENCILDGGGLEAVITFDSEEDSNAVLDGFTVTNGSNSRGGGIYLSDDSSPKINNCIIRDNNASSRGGGLYSTDGANPIITNTSFINNHSDDRGGGMFCNRTSPQIISCQFDGNNAVEEGGGLYLMEPENIVVQKCVFMNNIADKGAGIYFNRTENTPIIQSSFISNVGNDYGGAIYMEESDGITLQNCLFVLNEGENGGGAFYFSESSSELNQCTLFNNTTDEEGGGLFIRDGSNVSVVNSILWNDNGMSDSEISLHLEGLDNVTVIYSDVENGTGENWFGEGSIDIDPKFVDISEDDFHLQDDSLCKGAGQNSEDLGVYGGELGNW